MLEGLTWGLGVQDGGGTKEKATLRTSRDAFAMRFSVNQCFQILQPARNVKSYPI